MILLAELNWLLSGFLLSYILTSLYIRNSLSASASGLISTSAKVTGALFDHDDSNNTATVSVRVGQAAFTPVYMFTDAPCVHGEPFDTPAQSCKRIILDGKRVLANEDIRMHITYTINDVPTSLAPTDTTVKMKFALSCHDPGTDAGRVAKFYPDTTVISLALCAQQGLVPAASSSVWGSTFRDIVFTGNWASSTKAYTFNYADVGRIELLAIDQSGNLGSTAPFVSRPAALVMPALSGNNAGMPAAVTDSKYIPAGQNFTITVQAYSSGATPVLTPNFGKELVPVVVKMPVEAATDADGEIFPEMAPDASDPTYVPVPELRGTLGAFSGGAASGSFAFDEVGTIRMSATVVDYLGTGSLISAPVNVGRFYPYRFSTAVPTPPSMPCPKQIACAVGVVSSAYSKQPFEVRVTAQNAVSGAYGTTRNYRGDLARDFFLGAYATAQGTAANPPGTVPGSALSAATGTSALFNKGVASVKPVYTFSGLPAGNYQSPIYIYLRASEVAAGGDGVTSKITGGEEAGVLIITGRMTVGNGYGSEKLPMPVRYQAEFFGGGAGWLASINDNVSTFTNSDLVFTNCKKNLLAGGACKAVLVPQAPGTYRLVNGVVTVKLAAPGTGNDGSTDLNLANPVWLPSGKGRLTFGTYRAPYIYLREMY